MNLFLFSRESFIRSYFTIQFLFMTHFYLPIHRRFPPHIFRPQTTVLVQTLFPFQWRIFVRETRSPSGSNVSVTAPAKSGRFMHGTIRYTFRVPWVLFATFEKRNTDRGPGVFPGGMLGSYFTRFGWDWCSDRVQPQFMRLAKKKMMVIYNQRQNNRVKCEITS